MPAKAHLPAIAHKRYHKPPNNYRGTFNRLTEDDGIYCREALSYSMYRFFTFLEYCFPSINSPDTFDLAELGMYLSDEKTIDCQFCFNFSVPMGQFLQDTKGMTIEELQKYHLDVSPYCPHKHKNIFNIHFDRNYCDGRFEIFRLHSLVTATYRNPALWGNADPLERCLALMKSGFTHAGPGDLVHCTFCHLQISMWEDDDDVSIEHFESNPNCPLKTHPTCVGNVFLGGERIKGLGTDSEPFEYPVGDRENRSFPNYENWQLRLESFNNANWRHGQLAQLGAKAMADSGFFYTGFDDLVACYNCGIGLEGWGPEDTSPHEVHTRLGPQCSLHKR